PPTAAEDEIVNISMLIAWPSIRQGTLSSYEHEDYIQTLGTGVSALEKPKPRLCFFTQRIRHRPCNKRHLPEMRLRSCLYCVRALRVSLRVSRLNPTPSAIHCVFLLPLWCVCWLRQRASEPLLPRCAGGRHWPASMHSGRRAVLHQVLRILCFPRARPAFVRRPLFGPFFAPMI